LLLLPPILSLRFLLLVLEANIAVRAKTVNTVSTAQKMAALVGYVQNNLQKIHSMALTPLQQEALNLFTELHQETAKLLRIPNGQIPIAYFDHISFIIISNNDEVLKKYIASTRGYIDVLKSA
jgi:hypothetical protein